MANIRYKEITYKGFDLVCNSSGKIYYQGKELPQFAIKPRPYLYCQLWDTEAKKNVFINVARVICAAFCPEKNWQEMQVDHIDSNPTNNRPYNLRFLPRNYNNKRLHKRRLQSKNHKHTHHYGEVITAKNKHTGEIKIFNTAQQFADFVGHSVQHIYMVCNPDHWAKTAKGWFGKWVKAETVEG